MDLSRSQPLVRRESRIIAAAERVLGTPQSYLVLVLAGLGVALGVFVLFAAIALPAGLLHTGVRAPVTYILCFVFGWDAAWITLGLATANDALAQFRVAVALSDRDYGAAGQDTLRTVRGSLAPAVLLGLAFGLLGQRSTGRILGWAGVSWQAVSASTAAHWMLLFSCVLLGTLIVVARDGVRRYLTLIRNLAGLPLRPSIPLVREVLTAVEARTVIFGVAYFVAGILLVVGLQSGIRARDPYLLVLVLLLSLAGIALILAPAVFGKQALRELKIRMIGAAFEVADPPPAGPPDTELYRVIARRVERDGVDELIANIAREPTGIVSGGVVAVNILNASLPIIALVLKKSP